MINDDYFSYIMATSFSGGRSRSTRREPPTMGKQLVDFITCGCESSAPIFVNYKAGRIFLKESIGHSRYIIFESLSYLSEQVNEYTHLVSLSIALLLQF
jgi:hypothetical protein